MATATGTQQSPAAVTDEVGGAYLAWVDQRSSGAALYMQRLTRLGGVWPGWPTDGILIAGSVTSAPVPTLLPDGAGGVYVAWSDARAMDGGDIYAQRVGPDGAPQWTAGGVAVCAAAGSQFPPRAASDGSGGIVLAWEDGRSDRDVYAQRLSAAGVPQWTANGVLVAGAVGQQGSPDIAVGSSGSVVVAWHDSRSGNDDIYAQRLTSSGAAAWAANGVPLSVNAQHQSRPRVAPDGAGGAYVVWEDQRSYVSTQIDLYAQRVGSSGALQWPAMGVAVCTMGLDQVAPVVVATANGLVVAWEDFRPGTLPPNRDIFAQRLLPSGAPAWAIDGVDLASIGGDQFAPAIVHDGKEGVLVAWTDTRSDPAGDIFGTRIDSAAVLAPGWTADGSPLAAAPGGQQQPAIAPDGESGAILAFRELVAGSPSGYDVRAQRIGRHGRPRVEPVAMIPDGAGGTFVAWEDYGQGADADVRVQRFSADGAVAMPWPAGGVAVSSAAGNQQHPALCSDGAGGVFVTWEDGADGPNRRDVRVQRLTGTGAIDPAWPPDGIDLVDPGSDFDERRPRIVPDGSGGAFVAWIQGGLSVGALYVQRVDAAGVPLLGTPLGAALVGGYDSYSIAADGAGGLVAAYQAWALPRSTAVARFDGAGTMTWGPVTPSPDGVRQQEQQVAPDGMGGVYVAWRAESGGPPTPSQIVAVRLDAAGLVAPGWPGGGLLVTAAAGNQYDLSLAGDGLGNALLAWTDERTLGIPDVYAQRVTALGGVSWTAGGLAVAAVVQEQTDPVVAADGGGGALISWQDRRGGTTDVFAQRITAAGAVAPRWTAGGILVARLPATAVTGDQYALAIAGDGEGGAHLAWYDTRGGFDIPDVQMLRVDAFGIAGDHGLQILSVRDVPQDEGGRVVLRWSPHVLDRAPAFDIGEYWIWRQVPGSEALAASQAAAEASEPGAARPRRGQRMRSESFPGYYWEFVEARPASGFSSGYSYVAATTADSTSAADPWTRFMVQARHRTVLAFWSSAPDSGRSVDNIAPGPPGAFVVQYFSGPGAASGPGAERDAAERGPEGGAAGYAWLHWAPSREPDFLEYRIHRGSGSSFEPDPSNLIATRRDTGWVDHGAPPSFYKLLAVDVHGNVSVAAAAAPENLLEVSGSAGPAALRLAPPRPNPFTGRATLGFELPRAGDVALEIYDAAGRHVRTLLRGAMPSGKHTVAWEGIDRAGRAAPAGVYHVRLAASGRSLTTKVVLMNR